MDKREAKRRVCAAAAVILDPIAHENAWLYEDTDADNSELSQADADRMVVALNELVDELLRRARRR